MTEEVKTPPVNPDPAVAALEARVKELAEKMKGVDPELKTVLAGFAAAGEATLAEVKALRGKVEAAEAAGAARMTELATEARKNAVAEAAKAAGAIDADAALALVKLDEVKLGADGKPLNAAEVVEALKKAKPALFTPPAANTTTAAPKPTAGETKAKAAKDMAVGSPEYNAALQAVGVNPNRIRRG